MFDKIKQKLHNNSSENATTQHTNKSNPSINEPSNPSSPSTRHQSEGSVEQPGRLSVSDDRTRGRSGSLAAQNSTPTRSRSRSRARDVLWNSSLFDPTNPENNVPRDPNLRAKSSSVAVPHPTMAEEDMKRMPYTDWSKKQ